MKDSFLERFSERVRRVSPRLGAEIDIIAFNAHTRWLRSNRGRRVKTDEGREHIERAGKIAARLSLQVSKGHLPDNTLERLIT